MTLLLDGVDCPYCRRSDAVEDVSDAVRQARRMAYCSDCSTVFPIPDRPRLVTHEPRPRRDLE